jgi:hypothetical protein
MSDTRDPATDQAAPVPNEHPSMHDLVVRDLSSRDLRWDLSIGRARRIRDEVCDDLAARKAFGLAKYGTPLQPFNGRDMLRDLYDELLDASVYARGRMCEVLEDGLEWPVLAEVYETIVLDLVRVRRLLDTAGPYGHRTGPLAVDASFPVESEAVLAEARRRLEDVKHLNR